MKSTKLFTTEQVKKFFNILGNLSKSIPIDQTHYPWKDYQAIYTKDSNHVPCTREVFAHRTISKWLKGKALIIYKESDLGIIYKQYVRISSLRYCNDWGFGYINVGIIDYSRPYDPILFDGLHIKHNDALQLEGEWCDNLDKHNQILNLVTMSDVSDKEYVFKAYDWSKYPKRKKKGIDPIDLITTTKSFIAKTEKQACELKKQFENLSKEIKGQLSIGDLIEIKEIKKNNL